MKEPGARDICGVVMPISAIDGLSEAHWADVLGMISEAASKAGFIANLVSNADDVGVIQKRIIQNLYDNAIVVCDVSGKNPNVMFELGMRLAFNKPTIIVKDDKTSYSFDTSPIEHVSYPRESPLLAGCRLQTKTYRENHRYSRESAVRQRLHAVSWSFRRVYSCKDRKERTTRPGVRLTRARLNKGYLAAH